MNSLKRPERLLIDVLWICSLTIAFSILSRTAFAVGTPVAVAELDIKPGSDPNAINIRSRGNIPVAILTTGSFDAGTVDVSTVQFGPGTAPPVRYALEDVDGDTDWDLILHFNTQETGVTCGDTEATLTGLTSDGTPIAGMDYIKTVSCN